MSTVSPNEAVSPCTHFAHLLWLRDILSLTWGPYSDGIARVHGMANVQAEELVE